MYTDVDVAERLHSWTAAAAMPTCAGESVEVVCTTEPHRDISRTFMSRQPHSHLRTKERARFNKKEEQRTGRRTKTKSKMVDNPELKMFLTPVFPAILQTDETNSTETTNNENYAGHLARSPQPHSSR